jgi:hypothetical protein
MSVPGLQRCLSAASPALTPGRVVLSCCFARVAVDMGFTQFMHFSVTTFGKVATGKDVEHDCALPPHDA